MNCFNHVDTAAVAMCKNCHKGLCKACAVELKNGISCKGNCEDEVKAINEILDRGKTAYQKTSSAYMSSAVIFGLIGALFTILPLLSYIFTKSMNLIFMFPIGIVFLLGACLNVRNSRKIKKIGK